MVKVILTSSISNLLTMLLKICLTFIMAPILLRSLGDYDYGLWEMLGLIVGYMGVLDLGIKPAISRYISLYNAKSDLNSAKTMYSSAFCYMVFVGLLLALLMVYVGVYQDEIFYENLDYSGNKYSLLCFVLALQFVFTFPGYVAESTLEGLKLYHIKNLIIIINSIVGASLLYNYIEPQNALVLLALVNTCGLIIKFITYFVILYKFCPTSLNPFEFKPRFKELKSLIVFGGKSLVQGLAYRIENATDSLIVGSILGPAIVPFYSIPANLVSYIRMVSMQISHVFMPIFSELYGEGKATSTIANTYILYSRIIVAINLMLAMCVVSLGEAFIRLWIGAKYTNNIDMLLYFLIGFTIIPLLNPLSSRYLTAVNKHVVFAKWAPISAVINISLSIPLTFKFGYVGTAAGSLIPVLIVQFVYFKESMQLLNSSRYQYIQAVIFPIILPITIMLLALTHLKLTYKIDNFYILFSVGFVGALIFTVSALIFSTSLQEKRNVYQWLKYYFQKSSP